MTPLPQTIAAVATPAGQGGVAVIRVSGPDAVAVVSRVFRGAPIAEPHRVYVGHLLTNPGGPPIDQVLTFFMAAPRSYTGEDVVEVQCHGGSIVSRRVLESIIAAGARPAAPGEFTKRAFLNGRIDLAQAEAVADLIVARSDAGSRLAWSQLQGQLSSRVERLRAALVDALALCEAAIDFPDEDVPELTGGMVAAELARVRTELQRLVASFTRARVRYDGALVALVGKPNVGKSSLLNVLVGRERAIVTPVAGTTRDVVEAALSVEDVRVVLADTAGIRDTSEPVERLGVDRTRAALRDAACAIAVFDCAAPLDDDDRLVAAALGDRSVVAVLNKCDLTAAVATDELRELLPRTPIVETSTLTGAGVEELTRTLAVTLLGAGGGDDEEISLYRVRHRDAALRAVEALERAEAALAATSPPELIASDLDAATTALATITGVVTSDDVLDRVFAEFCIGK